MASRNRDVNILEYIHKQGYLVTEIDPFVRQKAPSFSELPYDEKFKIVKEVIDERHRESSLGSA